MALTIIVAGVADDGLTIFTYYMDMDGDFFGDPDLTVDTCGALDPNLGFVLNGFDCDDSNADVNPVMMEVFDSLDNDCNGLVDDGVTSTDEDLQIPVRIFPNPTNGNLTIEFDHTGQLNVQLFHANGQLMKKEWLDFSNRSARFEMGEMGTGIYYLMAVDAEGVNHFVEKVVRL